MRIGRIVSTSLALGVLAFHPIAANAATTQEAPLPGTAAAGAPCGSETMLETLQAADPGMAARRAAIEALVLEAQRSGLVQRSGSRPGVNAAPIYTIPVVVHIVHAGGPENISDAQVLSQIAAINRDCQNLVNAALPAVDCRLSFCLATRDANGSPVAWPGTPGITRSFNPTASIVHFGNNGSDLATKAVDYFPSNQFLNVWVVRGIWVNGSPSGIVGYATFPGSVPAIQDGIVMDYRVMGADNTGYGSFSTLLPTYTEGKVFAHEVGHWLDLFHPFHGGCSVGDQVADTPPEANNNWGCPTTTILTCGNTAAAPDPIHNFMEYTNDPCRYQFTNDQRTRMHAAITNYRSQLVSPANLSLVGACPSILFANVTLTPSQGCGPLTVQCSTPTCGGCSYSWTAQGGSVANPTAASTSATFNTPGPHPVTVTVTDASNNTSTASATVYVTNCQPISGRCANWVFGNNARLDFTSGYPVPVSGTSNLGHETATQISSGAGSLLFYSDNEMIWNTTNAPMAGSMSGSNPVVTSGNSSHTGAIVIPRPGSATQYYMFSVREAEQFGNVNPLKYHTIDMSLSGGLGTLIAANTVIPLPANSSGQPLGMLEGVTAVPHCNGTDWWIVTAGARWGAGSDWQEYLYVTPVTSAGAGTTVAHQVGFFEANATNYSAWGTITASRDGARLALCQSFSQAIHICDFDRATGVPTLALNTGDVDANQDVAFSPDGKIVYYPYLVGLHQGLQGFGMYGLRQMELSTQSVRTLRAPTAVTAPADVELGPDGKVYSARAGQTSLDCINDPNNFNALYNNECGYNPLAVPLGAGAMVNVTGSLPNTLGICGATALPPAQFSYTVTGCNTVHFKTPNCSPWSWSFGDGGNSSLQNPSHTYAAGTWTVTLTTSGTPAVATQQITIGAQPVSIAGPGNACGGPNLYTAVGPSTYTYAWTITGGLPASASGGTVLVSWGPNGGSIQLTATDPKTGCTSTASFTNDGCGSCTKPPADMVAWWPLDETSGPLAQEIVGAIDGQDANGPTVAGGAVSNCRQFQGTNGQHVLVNDHPKLNLGTGNLSIDAWIQTSSSASYQTIVEKRALSSDQGYALYLENGRLALWLGDGSAGTVYTDANAADLADGLWHHVAATVDRFNATTGTRLYVDGAMILFQPGYASSASVSTTVPLRIGVQGTGGGTTDWFAGRIDEVEIFSRALDADEVLKVWGAGAKGKCKEFLHVPMSQVVCQGQAYVVVPVTICNLGPTASYNLTFAGLSTCSGPQPTAFQFHVQNQGNPVPVQGGQCVTVPIRVTPAAMSQGQIACFTVTATNTSSAVTRVTRGALGVNFALCPTVTSAPVSVGGIATPRTVTYHLESTMPSPVVVPVTVEARLSSGEPLGPGMAYVSLNGLPPGVPWTANYFIDPGTGIDITVEASFQSPLPFEFFDLVLGVDPDFDGDQDLETAAGFFYSERAVPLVGVEPRPVAAGAALLGASPNPFRGDLTVEFALARRGAFDLAMFDVGGRRVRSVARATAGAGRHVRTVDAAGLASGVYFLRLEAEGRVLTRRVVLIRE